MGICIKGQLEIRYCVCCLSATRMGYVNRSPVLCGDLYTEDRHCVNSCPKITSRLQFAPRAEGTKSQ
jgi:hypothetical protein